jgi:periplasmic divalent cation tolerance protein
VPAIVDRVKATHPYEVPGISARPIIDGNPDYLQWMLDETQQPSTGDPDLWKLQSRADR